MRLELVGIMLAVLAQAPPSQPPATRVFQRLFVPATTPASLSTLDAIRSVRRDASSSSRVVCGMTVVTPDPALQAPMPMLHPPKDRLYTMRVDEPPVCSGRAGRSR
jgi:hypothetical protein